MNGGRIKEFRVQSKLTQAVLAQEMGVTQQAVGQWETGRASPKVDQLPRLAELLHCTIDELFDSEGA